VLDGEMCDLNQTVGAMTGQLWFWVVLGGSGGSGVLGGGVGKVMLPGHVVTPC
tara:strand:- start:135 stop:293 length:159 start_codon:yes stop_codon:yes gene_type:complete